MQKISNFLDEFNKCMKSKQIKDQRNKLHSYVNLKNQNLFIFIAFVPPLILPYMFSPIIKDYPIIWTVMTAITAIFSIGILVVNRIRKHYANKNLKNQFNSCFNRVFRNQLKNKFMFVENDIKSLLKININDQEKQWLLDLITDKTYLQIIKMNTDTSFSENCHTTNKYNLSNDDEIKDESAKLFINLFSEKNTKHYELDRYNEGILDEKKLEKLQLNALKYFKKVMS